MVGADAVTWTRLGDDDNDRPDHLSVSRSARLLNHEAKVYCNKHLTDGALPRAALPRITDSSQPDKDAAELVGAGIWTETPTGWRVDWRDQERAADVRARQEANADKQARYRRRKAAHDRGDHSECDSRFCRNATGDVTGNAASNVTRLVTPSRPDPSRPVPTEGQGQGQGGDSPAAQARRPSPHQWQDDGSGKSCAACLLGPAHAIHALPENSTPVVAAHSPGNSS